jgi:hypothetical protein
MKETSSMTDAPPTPEQSALAAHAEAAGLGHAMHPLTEEGQRAARAIEAAVRRLVRAETAGANLTHAQIVAAAMQFAGDAARTALHEAGAEHMNGDEYGQMVCSIVAPLMFPAPDSVRMEICTNLVMAFTPEGEALRTAMARATSEGTA